jgi:hypothetical protein
VIIEETDEFTSGIPVIDDGDVCGQIEHGATAKALANRTKHLKRRVEAIESVTRPTTEEGGTLDPVLLPFASADNTLDALQLPNESKLGASNQIGVMGRRLAAWIRYTHDRILGLRPGTTTIYLPLIQVIPAPAAKWDRIGSDVLLGDPALAQIANDSTPLYLAIPLPSFSGVIQSIGVYCNGGAGHGGLPATMPRLRLMRPVTGIGVITHTEIAAVNDGSATVGAYQSIHSITLSSLGYAIQPTPPSLWTYLKLTGESGANSIGGEFKISGLFVNVTPS